MKYYSTRNAKLRVSPREAILNNLCPDGGLFLPETIPQDRASLDAAGDSLEQIALRVLQTFLSPSFSGEHLGHMASEVYNFKVPLVALNPSLSVLELTHGPSLSFKDFGARLVAACLKIIAEQDRRQFTVLTATSGDTGGAVAAALHGNAQVRAIILYPLDRISRFQASQMNAWRGNIVTVGVRGSFDDCQTLVKQAFNDPKASVTHNLLSANSINAARLLAQMVYYLFAMHAHPEEGLTFIVPCGNLGNITAGIMAARFRGQRCRFIAAHNANSTFPDFLTEGRYSPRPSIKTYSNAMDVGAPSNFERIQALFEGDVQCIRQEITAVSVDDEQTLHAIRQTSETYNYVVCPHTAVGIHAAAQVTGERVVLATAHPDKFKEIVARAGVLSFDEAAEANSDPAYCIDPSKEALLKILETCSEMP